jgi:hypothetical protein
MERGTEAVEEPDGRGERCNATVVRLRPAGVLHLRHNLTAAAADEKECEW